MVADKKPHIRGRLGYAFLLTTPGMRELRDVKDGTDSQEATANESKALSPFSLSPLL